MSTIILSLLLIILSPVIVVAGFIVLGSILSIFAIAVSTIIVLVAETAEAISDFVNKLKKWVRNECKSERK